MFPLLEQSEPNPAELFQIWINLPKASKFVPPHFSMFWNDSVPNQVLRDQGGRAANVRLIAGALGQVRAPSPPPDSWAARRESDVAIHTIELSPGASYSIEPTASDVNRTLYFFRGDKLQVGTRTLTKHVGVRVKPDAITTIINGRRVSELLMLQGRPIGEPIARRGPFVMNEQHEISQAYADYQSTQFGGWPWSKDDPVHSRDHGRFAIHADGRRDQPG
jgi:redox-sensitive bicupin YhaK (pirin superfamily)